MHRLAALVVLCVVLTGCREVRVKTYTQGTTSALGGRQILVIRDEHQLDQLGIHAPVQFRHEFAVVLLMGPHRDGGWHQVIESIRANESRVRIVAFEREPADGGEPVKEYRTYTLWVVPNSVYRRGSAVEVVTPSGEQIATTVLR